MVSFRIFLLAGLAAAALLERAVAAPAVAQDQVASLGTGRFIGEREVARRMAELVQQRNGGRPVEISFHPSAAR